MARKKSANNRMAIAGMFGIMTVLMLFLAKLVPNVLVVPVLLLAGLFISGLMVEEDIYLALFTFVGCALLGLLLGGGMQRMAPYLLFFGWYGIVKFLIEGLRDRVVCMAAKLVLFNCMMALSCAVAPGLFAPYIQMPVLWGLLLMQAIFLVFDAALWLFARFYAVSLRRKL